jgi:hypothetical protein
VTYRTLCKRCTRWADSGHAYRRWYGVARGVLRRLSEYYNVDYGTLCDVVAITSPRVSVKQNLLHAIGEILEDPRPSSMLSPTEVALDHYYRTKEIRGAKTSRFACVLRGDDDVVVVDTWMGKALGIPPRHARHKANQVLAERVVGHVAKRTGWTLASTQAAIWAGYMRGESSKLVVPLFRVETVGLSRTGPNGQLSDVPF